MYTINMHGPGNEARDIWLHHAVLTEMIIFNVSQQFCQYCFLSTPIAGYKGKKKQNKTPVKHVSYMRSSMNSTLCIIYMYMYQYTQPRP